MKSTHTINIKAPNKGPTRYPVDKRLRDIDTIHQTACAWPCRLMSVTRPRSQLRNPMRLAEPHGLQKPKSSRAATCAQYIYDCCRLQPAELAPDGFGRWQRPPNTLLRSRKRRVRLVASATRARSVRSDAQPLMPSAAFIPRPPQPGSAGRTAPSCPSDSRVPIASQLGVDCRRASMLSPRQPCR